ncbi:hypothetical protein [Desulfoluna butyratoxydans]|uniref:Uncharacterized protein n=1 Tax=Desulfoluna butyratoxydans TaxID=231438 RepID=A0A4V6IM45_9BACT|nr:hypothetical protein [Desulfoluna butyratoxydans]VFQ47378.1 hypothetical protein MSL71_50780 [Desulfoluna butyratoxydans]
MCSRRSRAMKLGKHIDQVERIEAWGHKIVATLDEVMKDVRITPCGGWTQIAGPKVWGELIEEEAGMLLQEMRQDLAMIEAGERG